HGRRLRPLHPPGQRGGDLAGPPAAARPPAPGPALRQGKLGPRGSQPPAGRVRPLARTVDDAMSTEQSAAMPSPFTPIADYAFLSDCHTGALIAPDGGVDWLCVPKFDSPSVFGALLDREAGAFRLGPFGINFPGSRAYEPGTNILVTTWHTPRGWVVVRDALTMGPRPGVDEGKRN